MANDFVTKLNSAIENSRAKGVPDYAIGAALFDFLDRYQNRIGFLEQLKASTADSTLNEEDYLSQLLMGMQEEDVDKSSQEMNQQTMMTLPEINQPVPIVDKTTMEPSDLKTKLDMFGTKDPLNIKDASNLFQQPTESGSTSSLGTPQNLAFAYETAKSLMGAPNITPEENPFKNLQTGKSTSLQNNNLNKKEYDFDNLPTGSQFLKDQ